MAQPGQIGKVPARQGPDRSGLLSHVRNLFMGWVRNDSGATAVEYGLICALIFLVIVTSVTSFGNKTTNIINTVSAAIAGAIGP